MGPFWVVFSALAFSISWLLPNHSLPWNSFHGDAWAAFVLLPVACYVLWRAQFQIYRNLLNATVFLLALIPMLQFTFDKIVLFGIAWINSAYLIGLLLAIVVGASWEKKYQNQSGDFVFLSVVLASLVSVALQIHQFFHLADVGPWILQVRDSRQFANMGQPNLLASLLLLGCVGCAWAYARKLVPSSILMVTAIALVLGLVLTESRTAWLNFSMFIVLGVAGRKFLPEKRFIWMLALLGLLFLLLTASFPAIKESLLGQMPLGSKSVISDPRWIAWKMFLKAALYQPMSGYGWGQLAKAQFLMMDENIVLGGSYLQAHNLFLDLVLWNGFPVAILVAAVLGVWYWKVISNISNFYQLLLLAFVNVLGIHAMLEYPLQYAYFLLPMGLVMGALSVSTGLQGAPIKMRWVAPMLLFAAASMLSITIVDYFKIESSLYGLRFEMKHIESNYDKSVPDVHALNQWRDYLVFARMTPKTGLANEDIQWMRNIVTTVPSPYIMYKLALMLALNGGGAEAGQWLKKLCLTSPGEMCSVIKLEWANQSLQYQDVAAVAWPFQ